MGEITFSSALFIQMQHHGSLLASTEKLAGAI